jgi:hypothetical protein
MDVSEIIRIVVIAGLILIALPFPIVLAAAGVAFAIASFVAIETLLGFTRAPGAGREGRPRVSGSRNGSAGRFG